MNCPHCGSAQTRKRRGFVLTHETVRVTRRTNQYLNKHLEQDHRGIKQTVRPLLGVKRLTSAARFCLAHEELRNSLRPVTARTQKVSLAQRRLMPTRRLCVLTKLLKAA